MNAELTSQLTDDEPIVMPLCAIFRRFLKRQGLKFTPERAKILNAVLSKEGVFEADQLLYEMRHEGDRVSKATIYRTLKHLLEAKIITEVLIDSKQAHYQLCFGKEAKGHLVCLETSKVTEFPTNEINQIFERVCREHGYEPVSYRFVIYGLSPEGKKAASESEE